MNKNNELNVVMFCAAECERQQSGERSVAKMFSAYLYAYHTIDVDGIESLNEPFIMTQFVNNVALLVDQRNVNGYRTTPVRFANFCFAINACNIPFALNSLYNAYADQNVTTDEFVKEFLDVHPFVDGNGRTAAIIYNALNGTMDNPVTLPDYYGG